MITIPKCAAGFRLNAFLFIVVLNIHQTFKDVMHVFLPFDLRLRFYLEKKVWYFKRNQDNKLAISMYQMPRESGALGVKSPNIMILTQTLVPSSRLTTLDIVASEYLLDADRTYPS